MFWSELVDDSHPEDTRYLGLRTYRTGQRRRRQSLISAVHRAETSEICVF